MTFPHLEYYCILVRDLEEISRYIEICEANEGTFSLALVQLLLAVGSEVDVVAKLLCKEYEPTTGCGNIDEYRDVLLQHIPKITTVRVALRRYEPTLLPWTNWMPGNNPEWWRAYNAVKHNRDTKYEQANLKVCLGALAGLCVLVAYLYTDKIKNGLGIHRPQMWLHGTHKKSGKALFSPGWELPTT